MKLADFDFPFNEDRIALRPANPRSSAKLLVATQDQIADQVVHDLPDILRPGDRLVLNDTKVIPARLRGTRHRIADNQHVSARVEITLLEPQADGGWRVLARPLRKLRHGDRVEFSADLSAEIHLKSDELSLHFNLSGDDFDAALNAAGAMPLPPYIEGKRPADDRDITDYQTIWARNSGAVAAPTASLHFDQDLFQNLQTRGVDISFVTLHVGAGTFLPVKVDDVTTHKMHAEWGAVSPKAAAEITATKQAGGRVIPVGTTALRLIETAATGKGEIAAFEGDTDIFIYPGFDFMITDALMTNFHLPKSTLMMLVAALMGQDRIMQIYAHAIAENYRFFSYGDASLLIPSHI
jgi:S-adenosylmethionine:tRNA ribosyltransferase-isomerase